jgi:hypothetical protein
MELRMIVNIDAKQRALLCELEQIISLAIDVIDILIFIFLTAY